MTQLTQKRDELACEFFREFARFEYALKEAEYYKFHECNGRLSVQWNKFAKSQSVARFFDTKYHGELGDAIGYLLEKPPMIQKPENGNLRWTDRTSNRSTVAEQLCDYVCRVRNNLFHGGKSNEDWLQRQRSELLLRHSLIVLRAFRDASPRLARAYTES